MAEYTGRRTSILKTQNPHTFMWSWNAPIPAGADPSNYQLQTNHAEVKEWLEHEKLGQYAPMFQQNNVSGAEVPFLNDDHLKEIGVTKVGHRIRLVKACKTFKRTLKNWERNETIFECQNWFLRPKVCVLFPTKFRFTPAAIVVYNPQPMHCGYEMDIIDVTTIIDINMVEFMGFLGYVEVLSTDKRIPKLTIRLRLHQAREAFLVLKNLWEEDQLRMGALAKLTH